MHLKTVAIGPYRVTTSVQTYINACQKMYTCFCYVCIILNLRDNRIDPAGQVNSSTDFNFLLQAIKLQ